MSISSISFLLQLRILSMTHSQLQAAIRKLLKANKQGLFQTQSLTAYS